MTLMFLRRLGLAIPTLLGVSVVIFLLMSVLPGDPLAGLLAQDATASGARGSAVEDILRRNQEPPR